MFFSISHFHFILTVYFRLFSIYSRLFVLFLSWEKTSSIGKANDTTTHFTLDRELWTEKMFLNNCKNRVMFLFTTFLDSIIHGMVGCECVCKCSLIKFSCETMVHIERHLLPPLNTVKEVETNFWWYEQCNFQQSLLTINLFNM